MLRGQIVTPEFFGSRAIISQFVRRLNATVTAVDVLVKDLPVTLVMLPKTSTGTQIDAVDDGTGFGCGTGVGVTGTARCGTRFANKEIAAAPIAVAIINIGRVCLFIDLFN